jgi:hypothetical protein
LKSARIHADRLSLLALVERLSSSVLRQITYQLRNSEEIKQLLGDRVHYAENWYGKSNLYLCRWLSFDRIVYPELIIALIVFHLA